MSLINMQDGVVKSPLVQQFQHRGADLARIQQNVQGPLHSELARQAEETVQATPHSENEGIREEYEERKQGSQQRRQRNPDEESEEQSFPRDTSSGDGKPHRIDITI